MNNRDYFSEILNDIKKFGFLTKEQIKIAYGQSFEVNDAIQSLLSGNWIYFSLKGFEYVSEPTQEELEKIKDQEPFSGDYSWE